MSPSSPLLCIEDLRVEFGSFAAVDGVDFTLAPGEVLGIVGESGSGKSVSMMALMGLIGAPGRVSASALEFQGRSLQGISAAQRRAIVGRDMAMIFQDALTSLNPSYTVGYQIEEVLKAHLGLRGGAARARALELLEQVEIPAARSRLKAYPHELSGGMNQRVMIAMAIACGPKLLIADEPTTALDVTIQAQILDLMLELKERLGMAILLITHAMGVVAETAQRVVVMYAGQVVEEAPVQALFAHPRHPYTQGLIRSIPRIDTAATHKVRLEAIAGTVPRLIAPPEGCRFAPRCRHAQPACSAATPPLRTVAPGHRVACILEAATS